MCDCRRSAAGVCTGGEILVTGAGGLNASHDIEAFFEAFSVILMKLLCHKEWECHKGDN